MLGLAGSLIPWGGRGEAELPVPKTVSGLAAWYRADLGLTLLVGDTTAVSGWDDQSGTGDPNKNLVQPNSSEWPGYVASDATFGHQPVLQFTGISSFMDSGADWASSVASPYTIYVAGSITGGETVGKLVGGPLTGSFVDGPFYGRVVTFFPSPSTNLAIGEENGAGAQTTVKGTNSTSPVVVCGVYNGTSSAIYIGDSQVPSATGSLTLRAIRRLTVGADSNNTNHAQGKLAEVIAYSGAHSASDRSLLMKYMGARYGLTVT